MNSQRPDVSVSINLHISEKESILVPEQHRFNDQASEVELRWGQESLSRRDKVKLFHTGTN